MKGNFLVSHQFFSVVTLNLASDFIVMVVLFTLQETVINNR